MLWGDSLYFMHKHNAEKNARVTDLGREGVFENVRGGKRSILECFQQKNKYV